ncbi:MAG: beta galactosidase jelly roll domain-containing protein [Treponema sp.]|nr:beta galactosidase jelly roll domain-containing protein [Treponema sp.]
MNEKPENFTDGIHNDEYENEYLQIRLEASQLVNVTGRQLESLNGKWNFGADLYDTCRRGHWFSQERCNAEGREFPLDFNWENWEQINVPSCWNLQKKELHYFEGFGVYTRTFRYFPRQKDERLLLRFEGAAYRTSIFLNGKFIGTHDGASTPFNVDVTDVVKTDNRIVVSVDARRSHLRLPMENTDWFNYGGIYRDVNLVRLPSSYIKDWFVRLDKNDSSMILADVYTSNIDNKSPASIVLEIPELGIKQEIKIDNGKGEAKIPAQPQLWSPESPKLYDITFSFNSDKDKVSDRIGFRSITKKGCEIFLNGKKIFLKGVCVHEDHFALGKTTSEEIIRSTIRDLKEMNGYYLRLAHYPHDARFARIADEEGVLLWEEIPVYWSIAFDNPGTYQDAENQLTELILRDRNRASVIIWSIGNENADTDSRLDFMSRLAKKAKQLDDSRFVSAACLIKHEKLKIEDRLEEFLDVIGINEYFGWYDPDFEKLPVLLANSNPSKPVLICEFGGDARLGHRGTIDDLWTEDKQKYIYEKQVETFKKCPYIAGTTPWIFYDFRCPRRLNRYQEGFNRKGLIDADRVTRKPAFYVMQEFYKD